MNTENNMNQAVMEVAWRIRELREISGFSLAEMAQHTGVDEETYQRYEEGLEDLPFSFIHKCAKTFGVEITDLLEGRSAKLTLYTVTRQGLGQLTAKEPGIEIRNMAPLFRGKKAEPYWVKYSYDPALQDAPIHLTTHGGHEFDFIYKGSLKVQVGDQSEILHEGDSIYYNSSTPHGMIAIDGQDCLFCAIILPGEEAPQQPPAWHTVSEEEREAEKPEPRRIWQDYIDVEEDEEGRLQGISFKDPEHFNFAFDVIDVLAQRQPQRRAMVHVDHNHVARTFTFADMSRQASRTANYFRSLGIRRGDRVMVVLKRHYQFWFTMLALHKLGAVAIPATNLLQEHDFTYRYEAAGVKAIVCTADGDVAHQAELAAEDCPGLRLKILVGGKREGWHDFDEEQALFSSSYPRPEDAACGSDPMLMFFTSGTTGYPKIASHSYKYALGHFITAKYWHNVEPDGLHLTIADTGWGKALWGKLYGQWLCEAGIFVYDFDRFDANDILPMFAQYHITTFCAPPTMYRFMIKEDLSRFDLSSIQYATTAGEALNPEVFTQFEKATGLAIMEGFGQTETTLVIANLFGMTPRVGSMGKPSPLYQVELLDADDKPVKMGQTGEICINVQNDVPCGLYQGYYRDQALTDEAWHDGWYHTGDTAWKDEAGYYWYVGRVDDLIKSSGYRIGPFEIESVLMELPYVLECGVSPEPDEIRGQVVKASIVLVRGTQGTEALKKEIQEYVKKRTAPYKYPRIVVFQDELPKTISGKIMRNKL